MNNLISIVTGFYCETKTSSFLVVTDINHHSVPSQTPISYILELTNTPAEG